MPAIVELPGVDADHPSFEAAFDFLRSVDDRFSFFKDESEVSRMNRGEIDPHEYSDDLREILALADETRRASNGYFDVKKPEGSIDPSGIVKGWAIQRTADLLRSRGHENAYVEVAGDLQLYGTNEDNAPWRIGIRNPENRDENIKIVELPVAAQ